MTNLSETFRQTRDALALLLGGLSPASHIVTPLAPDHRYQMVLSRYLFACRYAQRQSVLDFGSGSGFGAEPLMKAGATRYLGVEEYQRPIKHASRRYGSAMVSYRIGKLAAPSSDLDQHGLVLAFDLLARYGNAESVLRRVAGHVEPGGQLVVGVPLVATKGDIERSFQAGAKTSLYPWYWKSFCDELFDNVRCFRHYSPDAAIDWNEPSPSKLKATDFRFEEEESPQALCDSPGLAAFFVCSRSPTE